MKYCSFALWRVWVMWIQCSIDISGLTLLRDYSRVSNHEILHQFILASTVFLSFQFRHRNIQKAFLPSSTSPPTPTHAYFVLPPLCCEKLIRTPKQKTCHRLNNIDRHSQDSQFPLSPSVIAVNLYYLEKQQKVNLDFRVDSAIVCQKLQSFSPQLNDRLNHVNNCTFHH